MQIRWPGIRLLGSIPGLAAMMAVTVVPKLSCQFKQGITRLDGVEESRAYRRLRHGMVIRWPGIRLLGSCLGWLR